MGADIPARARVGDLVRLDNEYITAARQLIESTIFNPLAQPDAPTQIAAAILIEGIISSLNLNGVTATVVPGAFVPVGTGTNGSFTFTVRLNTGEGTEQITMPLTVAIVADSTTAVFELNAVAGGVYPVFLSVDNIPTFTGKIFRLNYDPTALTSTGLTHQDNLTVISSSRGEVAFIINTTVQEGTVWSGVLAVGNFTALRAGQTPIVLTIDQASAEDWRVVRFHFSNIVNDTLVPHEVDVPIMLGQSIASLGNSIPVPGTRYGRVGRPGQAFMGWFTQITPNMHYLGKPI